jgi:Ca2+-binding EF-hand superfamily protein
MGCASSEERESSNNYSNESFEHTGAMGEDDNLHRSHLLDKEWFWEHAGDKMFDALAKGKDKDAHIDKPAAALVANSLLVMGLEGMVEDFRIPLPMQVHDKLSDSAVETIKDKVRLRNTEAVDAVFNAIDSNHNGKIEKKEWNHIVRFASNGHEGFKDGITNEQKTKKMNDAFYGAAELVNSIVDPNGNGKISVGEVTHIAESLLENLMQVIHVMITCAYEVTKDTFSHEIVEGMEVVSWDEMLKPSLEHMVKRAEEAGFKDLVENGDGIKKMLQDAVQMDGVLAVLNSLATHPTTIQATKPDAGKEAEHFATLAGEHLSQNDWDISAILGSFGAAHAFVFVDLLHEFVTLLKDVKDDSKVSKSDFVNKVCKPMEDKIQSALHRELGLIHKSMVTAVAGLKENLLKDVDDDEKKALEKVFKYIEVIVAADHIKIWDAFWRCFAFQNQQIYEALFKVLKCGKTTNKIEKKALEAMFVVVLGEDKTQVKDRPKHVFDAFDHNGDGTFDKNELSPFVGDCLGLASAFAHCMATAKATFLTNHALPAMVEVAFMFLGASHGELDVQKAWMSLPMATQEPFAKMIKAKYKQDSAAVRKYQQALGKAIEKEFPQEKQEFMPMIIAAHVIDKLQHNC